MAATLKQLAEQCGVTKPTVKRRIDELGLADHVNTNVTPFEIDEYAASALAASFKEAQDRRRADPAAQDGDTGADSPHRSADAVLERYIASLEAQLDDKQRTIEALIDQNAALLARMDELANKTAESMDTLNRSVSAMGEKMAERHTPFWSRMLGSGN